MNTTNPETLTELRESTIRMNILTERIADASDGMPVEEMMTVLSRLCGIVCLEHGISKDELLTAMSKIYDVLQESGPDNTNH